MPITVIGPGVCGVVNCLPIGSSPGHARLRERLVDHRDQRRLQIVAIGEVAPLQQRNPHRLEVVGRDDVEARLRHRRRIRRRLSFDGVADHAAVAAERHRAHQRRRLHAGNRPHALDRALEEPRDVLRLRVLALRQAELQREHVRRVEAERRLLHRQQALDQQHRHRDQRHRHRHLDDGEDVAQPTAFAGGAAEAGLQHAADVGARRAQRRRQAAQHRDDDGDAAGEEQDAWRRAAPASESAPTAAAATPGRSAPSVRAGIRAALAATAIIAGFHRQLTGDGGAARAQRRAQRDLLLAIDGARQQQLADVDAGDQQHDADRRRTAAAAPAATSRPPSPAPARW